MAYFKRTSPIETKQIERVQQNNKHENILEELLSEIAARVLQLMDLKKEQAITSSCKTEALNLKTLIKR